MKLTSVIAKAIFLASCLNVIPVVQCRLGREDTTASVVDPDDAEIVVDSSDNNEIPRDLSSVLEYGELLCNMDVSPPIQDQTCLDNATVFSELVQSALVNGDEVLVVPCGACYTVDYTDGSTVTLPPGGMDILGRLHFPPTANVIINTTAVIVQGMMDMTVPNPGNEVKVTLYGTDEKFIYPYDECNGLYDETCTGRKSVGKKPIAIAGGQIDIQAIDPECPSWTKLLDVSIDGADNEFRHFEVDPAFAACIRPGDDLMLTSDDMGHEGDVGEVESIDTTTGVITLLTPISRNGMATVHGNGEDELAIEVAGLRRNVIFEAQNDDVANPMHGGHLIVFHTPEIVQTISGASFVNFGQDGNIGRYPIHFHMCSDTASIVSKNVVRNSNQRCYVIHDTNHVTVDDNVAYDTKGHCFITETGNEVFNTFSNNLGAFNKKLQVGFGQSDTPNHTPGKHEVAIFWFRNMKNDFVGNVAAGSAGIGYWIEMKDTYGDQLTPLSFKDNTAHSNFQGLLTYKKGWKPANGGVIENFKSYLNDEGMKFHITGLKIRNSLIADNTIGIRYGVWNTGVELENTIIKGYSDVAEFQKGRTCAKGLGIRPSTNTCLNCVEDAMKFTNVTFTKFNCNQRTITPYFDGRNANANDGMGQPIQATNTQVTDSDEASKPYFGCGSNNDNTYMEDIDGTLGPQGMGPGFIVRNLEHMTAFASCTSLPYGNGCSAFCENVCFRMVKIKPSSSDASKLVLTDGVTSTTYSPNQYGNFMVVVPAGNYNGHFLDADGVEIVSQRPTVTALQAPLCSTYVSESDFVFPSDAPSSGPTQSPSISPAPTGSPTITPAPSSSPTTTCEGKWYPGKNLVSNSNLDGGIKGYGPWGSKVFPYTPGYNSTGAIMMDRKSSTDTSLRARSAIRKGISTGCMTPGMTFSFTFQAKLINPTNSSVLIDCDPTHHWMECPAMRIRARNTRINGWFPGVDNGYKGFSSWTPGEWNSFEKIWTVPNNWIGPYNWFLIDIIAGNNYGPGEAMLIVDNLEMTLLSWPE